ncbi:hypothetical protein TrVE_jg2397 [Triparma verrucosa]|uniref:Uncharacterized protein n=1 Tax=Triparma verrucosa TaxID=1606542 RepID=A0A9W6ZGN6_9STRA|nr:hypothetical protein TrVE_jg2397 [Triparma verrucosa]
MQYSRSIKLPGNFQDRLFNCWFTWDHWIEDGQKVYIIAFCPMSEYMGTPHRVNGDESMVLGTTRGLHLLKEITKDTCEWTRAQCVDLNISGVPTSLLNFLAKQQLSKTNKVQENFRRNGLKTKVTMIQRIDVNGIIPTWLVSQKVPYALSVLQQAADYFRQDDLVEAEELRVLSNFLTEELKDEVYTAEENALIDRVSEKLDNLEEKEGTLTKVVSPDVFVKMDTTVVFDVVDHHKTMIGRAVTVLDASVEDCVAWELLRVTRAKMKKQLEEQGGLARTVTPINGHSHIFQNCIDLKVPSFAIREWVGLCVWKWVDEYTLVVCLEDYEDEVRFPKGGAGKKYIRASAESYWKYEKLADSKGLPQTRVTYCQLVDLKGYITKSLTNGKIVWTLMYLSQMREHFDRSLECDARDRAEVVKLIEVAGESCVKRRVIAVSSAWAKDDACLGDAPLTYKCS